MYFASPLPVYSSEDVVHKQKYDRTLYVKSILRNIMQNNAAVNLVTRLTKKRSYLYYRPYTGLHMKSTFLLAHLINKTMRDGHVLNNVRLICTNNDILWDKIQKNTTITVVTCLTKRGHTFFTDQIQSILKSTTHWRAHLINKTILDGHVFFNNVRLIRTLNNFVPQYHLSHGSSIHYNIVNSAKLENACKPRYVTSESTCIVHTRNAHCNIVT